MRRVSALFAAIGAFALTFAGPAASNPPSFPNSGCPTGFTLAPVSVLGDFSGHITDVNNDQMICIRSLPSGGAIFIDNTTP